MSTPARILILGGGVGGTLTANLLARKLSRALTRGEATITVVDASGRHVYQPGFMYIAMGGERAANLSRPERGLLDRRVNLVVGEIIKLDPAHRTVELDGDRFLGYEHLVLATGCRIAPQDIPYFAQEAHHFYDPVAAAALRTALDHFAGGQIVIGIAGMPYKCPPAPLEVALLIEAELRERSKHEKEAGLRAASHLHFCSPIGRAFSIESVSEMVTPILEAKGIELHTFFNVETIDPERKMVCSLEGEEFPYDLLILVPPHHGQQFLVEAGLAAGPGAWLPTDRHTLEVTGQTDVYALGDATDLPLSKAGSTAHFEAPVVAERIAARIAGRVPDAKTGSYEGKVMCFFEVGDGKGTLLQFDYDHPPRPPKPNRIWHLGKIVFNKTYWHTVPKGRV